MAGLGLHNEVTGTGRDGERRNRPGVLPLWRRRVGCRGFHRYTPLVNLKHKSRN